VILKSDKISGLAHKSLTSLLNILLKKTGLPAGMPVFTGETAAVPAEINIINYTSEKYDEFSAESVVGIKPCKSGVSWISLNGIHDLNRVTEVCQIYDIHGLVLEDILNTTHRPKIDEYGNYLFLIFKILETHPQHGFRTRQIAIIMKENTVITLMEAGDDIFLKLRQRIYDSKSRIRKKGPDYCLFAILDYIVDYYFPVLHEMSGEITALQQEAMKEPGKEYIIKIHEYKIEIMLLLRQVIWPIREICADMSRGKTSFISEDNLIYFSDVSDHILHLMEVAESLHEILSDMLNVYLSLKSNGMNEIMKVLTMIATVFIPLTFLAGIYGMNFRYMPGLEFKYGFYILLGLMFIVIILMFFYFKRNKWL